MSGDITGLPLLALLGCISGAIAGGLIILFRLSVESGSLWIIGSQSYQDFESLTALSRLLICFFGALIVGLLLHYLNPKARIVDQKRFGAVCRCKPEPDHRSVSWSRGPLRSSWCRQWQPSWPGLTYPQ